jgi:hypothetical protein
MLTEREKNEEKPTQTAKKIMVDRTKPKETEVILKLKPADKEENQPPLDSKNERQNRIIEEFWTNINELVEENRKKEKEDKKEMNILPEKAKLKPPKNKMKKRKIRTNHFVKSKKLINYPRKRMSASMKIQKMIFNQPRTKFKKDCKKKTFKKNME